MKKIFLLSLLIFSSLSHANFDSDKSKTISEQELKEIELIKKLQDPVFNAYISRENVYYHDSVICGYTHNIKSKKTSSGCSVLINNNYINYPFEALPFLEYGILMENYEIEKIEVLPNSNLLDQVVIYFKYKNFKKLIEN